MICLKMNLCMQGLMMASAGFFRLMPDLPKVFWRYPISYINYMAWGLQVKSLCPKNYTINFSKYTHVLHNIRHVRRYCRIQNCHAGCHVRLQICPFNFVQV